MIRTENLLMTSGIKSKLEKRGRDWRIVLRIDWNSGVSVVELRNNSEGSPMSAYKGLEMMVTLSSKLKVREIKALVEDIQPVIAEVREGWMRTIDTNQNIKGWFSDDGLEAVGAIIDRIDEWNANAEIK